MCTLVHFVLPSGVDASAIDALLEARKVGHGLVQGGSEAPRFVSGETAYLVSPWKMCHCGWEPRDFAPVVRDALEARTAPWLGVFVAEAGEEHDGTRVEMTVDEFVTAELEQDVLYVVGMAPPPPVVRRHGLRRRRSSRPR